MPFSPRYVCLFPNRASKEISAACKFPVAPLIKSKILKLYGHSKQSKKKKKRNNEKYAFKGWFLAKEGDDSIEEYLVSLYEVPDRGYP